MVTTNSQAGRYNDSGNEIDLSDCYSPKRGCSSREIGPLLLPE